MPRIVGRQPKPRALLHGIDDAIVNKVQQLFPTSRIIEQLREVNQAEWDVLITTHGAAAAEPHLQVVAIGGDPFTSPNLGRFHVPGKKPEESPSATWGAWVKATEFVVPDDLAPAIIRAVERALPLVAQHEDHPTLTPSIVRSSMPDTVEIRRAWRDGIRPFLLMRTGHVLAGRFMRAGGRAECWGLPEYLEAAAPEWIEVALGEWYKLDPETFPSAGWVDLPRWRTPEENRIARDLEAVRAKRAEMLALTEGEEKNLLAELIQAKQAAEARERRLLRGSGNDLVEVVASCLADLGFALQKMDDVYPAGDLREDLQVGDPDTPGWVALVEVKGYTGGARVKDLLNLERFRRRHVQDHSRDADAVWYVVN